MHLSHPQRHPLAMLPTPLVRLSRLSAALGGAAIWCKRDDLTGLELSGNKVRKLEYIVADAIARGADTLVTEGTPQSNHCRATAMVCARLGLHCRLLLRPEPPDPPVGNHLMEVLVGAQTRAYPRPHFDQNRAQLVEDNLAELRAAGRSPRWTPMGASEPLGCWGYLSAARELARQLDEAGLPTCDLVVAISSGGTYAGLVLGTLLEPSPPRWHHWAVPVSDDPDHHRREVGRLCNAAIEQYRLPIRFDPGVAQFIPGYVGAGYAVPYPAALDAIRLLARTEGILLDPVYTAKAFCAVLDGVRAGTLGRDRPVIFLHTGGIFSDFAWPELLAT